MHRFRGLIVPTMLIISCSAVGGFFVDQASQRHCTRTKARFASEACCRRLYSGRSVRGLGCSAHAARARSCVHAGDGLDRVVESGAALPATRGHRKNCAGRGRGRTPRSRRPSALPAGDSAPHGPRGYARTAPQLTLGDGAPAPTPGALNYLAQRRRPPRPCSAGRLEKVHGGQAGFAVDELEGDFGAGGKVERVESFGV